MLKKQILKYYKLVSEFGVYIALLEIKLRIIGRIFGKNTRRWENASKCKYDYINEFFMTEFSEIIEMYKKNTKLSKTIDEEAPIWIFWAQGIEKAPEIVKQCIKSIYRNSGKHSVIILDITNYDSFVSIDDTIIQKYKKGIISTPHFADTLRFKLLSEHGGIWCDATLFLSKSISELCIENHSWFSIKHEIGSQYLACRGMWTTFFIASSTDNIISKFVYEALCWYWKKYNYPIDYLFLDSILYLAYLEFDEAKKQIDAIPINNTNVFEAMFAFERMDNENDIKEIVEKNGISKLTYKIKCGEKQTDLMNSVLKDFI